MIIGIDIGGTNFRIGAVDEKLYVKNFKKIDVKEVFNDDKPLKSLSTYLQGYIKELNEKVEAISIGFPATINKDRNKVLQAPNIKYIENLDVVSYLEKELNIKTFLEKDTAMLLSYDTNKLNIDKGIVYCIYFGTGVGAMMAIDNKLVIGRNGTAGELGHLYIEGNNLVCGCGNVGCDESVVGGVYLKKLINEEFVNENIEDIFSLHKDHPLIKQYIDRMGVIVADIENILDPDYLIIGGGVIEIKDFPKDLLIERIKVHTRKPLPHDNMNLIFVKDDLYKGVIGAACYALNKIEN